MKLKYGTYCHDIDVDAFEEAIGWEPSREGVNKRGEAEDIGQCPDPWNLHKHGDSTGKFAINRDKRIYGCFVCGGGTLLDLAMAVRDIDEQEAERWLLQFTAPSERSDDEFLSEIDAILYAEAAAKPVMPYFNEHVLDRWSANIGVLDGWLADRGISMEVAIRARLGYQSDAVRRNPTRADEGPYSGPCVYLPHFWGGRLVGWQQRWLDDPPKWIPKYTNTSSFPKADTIYNYDSVYLADRPIVICESVPTVLFLTTLGYPAVATFGASVTEEQMRLLRLCQQGVVLAPDNDKPGYKWLDYTDEERRYRKLDRPVLADYLARYVPTRIIEPVGEYGSGNDLADLLDDGIDFARDAVALLYREASYI